MARNKNKEQKADQLRATSGRLGHCCRREVLGDGMSYTGVIELNPTSVNP